MLFPLNTNAASSPSAERAFLEGASPWISAMRSPGGQHREGYRCGAGMQ